MKIMEVNDFDLSYDDLMKELNKSIFLIEETASIWSPRTRPSFLKCISVMKMFKRGDATTVDVKAQFLIMTTLMHEVVLSEAEDYVALAMAGVSHASAHLGHLATSISHKGDAHRLYDKYQIGYVMLGFKEAHEFVKLAKEINTEKRKKKKNGNSNNKS